MSAELLLDYNSPANADPHVLSFPGRTVGRDILVLYGAGAIPSAPSPWEHVDFYLSGAFQIGLFHLPADENTELANITSLTLDMNAATAFSAIVWEDDVASAISFAQAGSNTWPGTGSPFSWGTGAHTFVEADETFAFFYGQMAGTTAMPGTFDVASYDNSYVEFADSGVALVNLSNRLWMARREDHAMSSGGVTATMSEARPGGWDDGTGGMVWYDVGAPPPEDPMLSRTPASLNFTAEEGGDNPTNKTVAVSNSGSGSDFAFTVSDDAAWLTVTPTSETTPETLTVSVDIDGLDADAYSGTITITATGVDGSPQTVAVNLVVTAPPEPPPGVDEIYFPVVDGEDLTWRKLNLSGLIQTFVYDTPEAHGAKRDCKAFETANISNGSAALTVTGAEFTIADIGKAIVVYGAGSNPNQNILATTIIDVVDSDTVTLDDAASVTVTDARGAYGTDDTAAINAAILNAVTLAQADGTNLAKVLFSSGEYMVASPTTQGGVALGNAQIQLPAINPELEKVTLELIGAAEDPTGWLHWHQLVPASSGTIIRSILAAQEFDPDWGAPSVIGGPGPDLDWGIPPTIQLSNMLVVIKGLRVVCPPDPSMTAVNLKGVAQAHIISLGCQADTVVAYQDGPEFDDPAENTGGMGLAMPEFGNNAHCVVDNYGCQGFYYGIAITDHFVANRLGLIYCDTGIVIVNFASTAQHGMAILLVDIEATATLIEVIGGSGKLPIRIGQLNTETGGVATDIKDPGNNLYGEIQYAHNSSTKPTVTGGKNVRIIDANQDRGAVASPAIPASGVPLVNPFWRDAAVYISGGTVTVIEVDGDDVGVDSGLVMVPSGESIELTYSAAPTWKWTLL